MSTTDDLIELLPGIDRSIIGNVQLERSFSLHDGSEHATLVIYTDRLLTADGGDGHNGIDGAAVLSLGKAINQLLYKEGGAGMIENVVIRQRNPNTIIEEI